VTLHWCHITSPVSAAKRFSGKKNILRFVSEKHVKYRLKAGLQQEMQQQFKILLVKETQLSTRN